MLKYIQLHLLLGNHTALMWIALLGLLLGIGVLICLALCLLAIITHILFIRFNQYEYYKVIDPFNSKHKYSGILFYAVIEMIIVFCVATPIGNFISYTNL